MRAVASGAEQDRIEAAPNEPGVIPSNDRAPGYLGAIVDGALVRLESVYALEPFISELALGERERVDSFIEGASADATLPAYKTDRSLFCV